MDALVSLNAKTTGALSPKKKELSMKEVYDAVSRITAEQIEQIDTKLIDKLKTTITSLNSSDATSVLEMAKEKFKTILSTKFSTPASLTGVGICLVGDFFADRGSVCVFPPVFSQEPNGSYVRWESDRTDEDYSFGPTQLTFQWPNRPRTTSRFNGEPSSEFYLYVGGHVTTDVNTWSSRPFNVIDPTWLPPKYSLCLYLDVDCTQSALAPIFVIEEKSEGQVLSTESFSLKDL